MSLTLKKWFPYFDSRSKRFTAHHFWVKLLSLALELWSVKVLWLLEITSVEKVRISKKINEGPKNIISEKSTKNLENFGKQQQILKNAKYIHFFQIFKHIKQQQHQINTLAHKYVEITNIYDVVDVKQI